RAELKERRLRPLSLVDNFVRYGLLNMLIGSTYRRAVFYFATGDPQVERYIEIPDMEKPDFVRDISFKYCGERLRAPAGFDDWYAKQPAEFQQFCYKREKGVDIEICCDALQLAGLRNLDRLILLTNDSDFIPLCEKLKAFGTNVSLIRLPQPRPVNQDLVRACDSFHVLPDTLLERFF